ncbi:MAG: sigma-70 family RNA polymerase sigma factor [Clostridia bacterium]
MCDYNSLADEKLVSLIEDGDDEALVVLTHRYMSIAKTIAIKVGGSYSSYNNFIDISDFIQEGMIGFLAGVYSYDNEKTASFRTYAGVCIERKMLTMMKSFNTKKKIPANLCQPLDTDINLVDTALTPEEVLVSKLEVEKITSIILKSLSEQEQLVFRLFLAGQSYDEISEQLNLTKKAVDSSLQRARSKLKKEIAKHD